MKNSVDIRTLIGHGEMAYDIVYTEGTVSWFKSEEDGYIYVLNTTTQRATRYNAEGQNGKRISIKEYGDRAQEMLDRQEAKNAKQLEIDRQWQETEDKANAAWEQELTDTETPTEQQTDEEWEAEADTERKAREDKMAADAKATEDAVNGLEHLSEDEKATIEPAEAELLENARKEKKAKKEAKKTARKPRKSKDVAYEGHGVTLTAKQVDFIHHLPDTCFWEAGVNSVIWCDVLTDDIKGQFANKPMTVGAMISTLCEKKLGFRIAQKRENRKCTSFSLTDLGKEIAKELGLE